MPLDCVPPGERTCANARLHDPPRSARGAAAQRPGMLSGTAVPPVAATALPSDRNDYFFGFFGLVWLRSLPATLFSVLVEVGFLRTFDASFATLGLVFLSGIV